MSIRAFCLLAAACFCIGPQQLWGEIKVEGTAADKTAFETMLKDLVKGATVKIENDTVKIDGTPTNEFGKHLKEIVDDTATITARVGVDQVNVFVGAFLGAYGEPGVQAIDLDDIGKYAKPGDGLPTKGSALIHELKEAFNAVKAGEPKKHLKHHRGSAKTAEDAVNMEEANIKRTTELEPIGVDTGALPLGGIDKLKPGDVINLKKTAKYQTANGVITVDFHVVMTVQPGGKSKSQLAEVKTVATKGGGKKTATEKEPGLRVFDDQLNPLSFLPLDQPAYLAMDLVGDILVVESRLNKVRVFDSKFVPKFEFGAGLLSNPQGIAVSLFDNLIFVSSGDNVFVFDRSGVFQYLFGHPMLRNARGLAVDRDGNLFVSSDGTDAILEFDRLTGAVLDVFDSPLLSGPEGIAVNQLGELWVSSSRNNQILHFDPIDRVFSVFASGGLLNGPLGLALAPQSFVTPGVQPGMLSQWQTSLLVSSFNNNQLLEFDLATGQLLNNVAVKTPVGTGQIDPLSPACDMNGDGSVDRNDVATIFAGRGSTAAPGDFRDVDGDGAVTANDARICTFQCTHSGCVP